MTLPQKEDSGAPRFQPLEWTDENVTRFWRWQAQFPQTYFTYQFGHRVADQLRSPLAGRTSVVDYGCGPGFLIPHLAALGKEVTATDFSPDAVANANRAYAAVERFRGAVAVDALVAGEARFDAAVSVEVVEHLNDDHLAGFFRNLSAVLRPGGIAVITTPNDEDLDLSMIYCPESDRVFHRWQHVRSWSAESLAASVTEHGFTVERTYTTDFSKRRFDNLKGRAKGVVKRMLGRPEKWPHLVCIARLHG